MSTTELLIADYLKRKGFTTSLKSFESELGITSHPLEYEPLEQIVEDRMKYLAHEISTPKTNDKIENSGFFNKWEDPTVAKKVELKHDQLIIHISRGDFQIDDEMKKVLFVTSSDKKLTLIDLRGQKVLKVLENLHQSVGKCAYCIDGTDQFLSCGMDGKIKLFKLVGGGEVICLSEVQLHRRIVTDFKLWNHDGITYIFSIGWDLQLKISKIILDSQIEIISNFKLLSNATSIALGIYENKPIIFLSRVDSTQLSLFTFANSRLFEISRISLNDAEFSTHGFTPMTISLTSQEIKPDTFIAIGTSHIPYMRLIIIKIPELDPLLSDLEDTAPQEQHLTSTHIHRGMILGNYNTLSPQDKYSQGVIHWRPNNSGVWISGDDGIIRGLDLKNGEIVQEHKGHEKRIKCLVVDELQNTEILVSSGIDKKLNYWHV